MADEFKDAGSLVTYLLTINLMRTLHQKGELSDDELREIIDHALLNLEAHQQAAGPSEISIVRGARALFEMLLQEIFP